LISNAGKLVLGKEVVVNGAEIWTRVLDSLLSRSEIDRQIRREGERDQSASDFKDYTASQAYANYCVNTGKRTKLKVANVCLPNLLRVTVSFGIQP